MVTRDAARSRKRRPGRKLAAVQTERKAGSWKLVAVKTTLRPHMRPWGREGL